MAQDMMQLDDINASNEDSDDNVERVSLSPESVLNFHKQGRNIAELVDDSELVEIGQRVLDTYKRDKASRQGWDEDMKGWINLALQVKEDKSFPWEGASNVKFPLATVAVIQFASRIMPAVIRTPNPVAGRVNGYQTPDKLEAAKRIGMHMSWQLCEEMDGWVDDQDTLFHVLPITGCAFKKTYRDAYKGTNVSELVMPDKLVFDYYSKSVEDARHVTHIYQLHPQEIEIRKRMGIFLEAELTGASDDSDLHEERNAVNNTETPQQNEDKPVVILEQHTWLDLDEDGLEEPYIVTVNEDSRSVLRIEPRFVPEKVYLSKDDGKLLAVEAESMFTHYVFIPDPSGGNLGLGWGRVLGPINESVNTAINQLIDNGTLNNMGGGMIDKFLNLPGGDIYREPGKYIRVDAKGQNIAQGIFPWPVTEPSQVLYQLLTLMVNWGQRITAVTDSMSGEIPAANVPATTTLAMLEQGQKVFQGIYARIYRALGRELKKLKELNKRYLEDAEYFRVLDGGTAMVTASDYQLDETDITLTAEQTLPSEQVAMARFRVLLEAANAGIKVNPELLNQMLVQVLGLPPESQQQVILPPEPDPTAQIQLMEAQSKIANEQARTALEGERIGMEKERIKTDAALTIAKTRLGHQQERTKAILAAGQLATEPKNDQVSQG